MEEPEKRRILPSRAISGLPEPVEIAIDQGFAGNAVVLRIGGAGARWTALDPDTAVKLGLDILRRGRRIQARLGMRLRPLDRL